MPYSKSATYFPALPRAQAAQCQRQQHGRCCGGAGCCHPAEARDVAVIHDECVQQQVQRDDHWHARPRVLPHLWQACEEGGDIRRPDEGANVLKWGINAHNGLQEVAYPFGNSHAFFDHAFPFRNTGLCRRVTDFCQCDERG
eukprot:1791724-Rhodomonas_salina.2